MPIKRIAISRVGFIVVIAILAIGMLIVIPMVQKVRDASVRTQVICELKQVTLATHSAADTWKLLPPATGSYGDMKIVSQSISIHVLPFIEQSALYKEALTTGRFPPTKIATFRASLDPSTTDFIGVQNYAANVRVFTDEGFHTKYTTAYAPIESGGGCSGKMDDRFPDGTSNTILFTTRYANNLAVQANGAVNCSAYDALLAATNGAFFGAVPATGPRSATSVGGWQLNPTLSQANCSTNAYNAMSFGPAGIQCGMGDGSVHSVSSGVSAATWNRAVQPNDGLPLGTDW